MQILLLVLISPTPDSSSRTSLSGHSNSSVQTSTSRFRNLHRVRRQLTDGTSKIHFYHRPTKTRLPPPHDPAFDAAYEAAEQLLPTPNKASAAPECNAPVVGTHIQPTAVKTSGALAEAPAIDFKYFRPEEVCRRWRDQIKPDTLANWRSLQIGPPYSKFGKTVLYRVDLLEQWERKNLYLCDRNVPMGGGNDNTLHPPRSY